MGFVDYHGRHIRLTDAQRSHISFFHPETLIDITKIEATLHEPDLLAQGATKDTLIYYKFFPETIVTGKFLAIVVKQLDDEGFIVTAYFTDRIKREAIWRRES